MWEYLQRLRGVGVGVVVQDDVVGHVEALPHAQVVEQGGLPKHVAHVHNRDVCGAKRELRRPRHRTRMMERNAFWKLYSSGLASQRCTHIHVRSHLIVRRQRPFGVLLVLYCVRRHLAQQILGHVATGKPQEYYCRSCETLNLCHKQCSELTIMKRLNSSSTYCTKGNRSHPKEKSERDSVALCLYQPLRFHPKTPFGMLCSSQ